MTLLIELLAHQFAMPVRWIETQALFFKDLGEGRTKPGFVFPSFSFSFPFLFVSLCFTLFLMETITFA
jgi:hypothetical protein